jgi:hypothetical protein
MKLRFLHSDSTEIMQSLQRLREQSLQKNCMELLTCTLHLVEFVNSSISIEDQKIYKKNIVKKWIHT